MHPFRLGAALGAVLLFAAIETQTPPAVASIALPLRTENLLLTGGRETEIFFPRLDARRAYRVRLTLVGQTSPSEGSLELFAPDGDDLFGGFTSSEALSTFQRLSRDAPMLETEIRPGDAKGSRLVIRAGGELGSLYRVRLEVEPVAVSRMDSAEYIDSPNQNLRPSGKSIDTIVVHATVTPTLEKTVAWFLTTDSKVSAHYVVGRDGKVVQMVEDGARAWHAGVSEIDGVKNVNDYSVGIEIVNFNDGKDPFTDAQYEAVAAIIRHIREQYPVPDSRIVSHEFVARPHGRKNDPVGFNFPRLLELSRIPHPQVLR